jgi:hypothetical protein
MVVSDSRPKSGPSTAARPSSARPTSARPSSSRSHPPSHGSLSPTHEYFSEGLDQCTDREYYVHDVPEYDLTLLQHFTQEVCQP